MGSVNFRDGDEFDPQTYSSQGGSWPDILRAALLQQEQTQLTPEDNGRASFPSVSQNTWQDSSSGNVQALGNSRPLRRIYIYKSNPPDAPADAFNDSSEGTFNTYSPFDPQTYSGQGGLLGRLLASQTPQSRPQNLPNINEQASPVGSSSVATKSDPDEVSAFDPADIAKSAGIGLVNGLVNSAGGIADAVNGFGYLPPHYVENQVRRVFGSPDLAPDEAGLVEDFGSGHIRHLIEQRTGEFYTPKSRAGRYAETIGEMAPFLLSGGVTAVTKASQGAKILAQINRNQAIREAGLNLLAHAVVPGAVAQTLKEAYPSSPVGQLVQNLYPVVKDNSERARTAGRYLSKKIMPY